MDNLERFIVEYFRKINTNLLDSNLFDIITKFMYTGIYKRFPYNLTKWPLIKDSNIANYLGFYSQYYPGYQWIQTYTGYYGSDYIAIGYNGTEKYVAVCIKAGSCCCCDALQYLDCIGVGNEKIEFSDIKEAIDSIIDKSTITSDPKKFILDQAKEYEQNKDEFNSFFEKFELLKAKQNLNFASKILNMK